MSTVMVERVNILERLLRASVKMDMRGSIARFLHVPTIHAYMELVTQHSFLGFAFAGMDILEAHVRKRLVQE